MSEAAPHYSDTWLPATIDDFPYLGNRRKGAVPAINFPYFPVGRSTLAFPDLRLATLAENEFFKMGGALLNSH